MMEEQLEQLEKVVNLATPEKISILIKATIEHWANHDQGSDIDELISELKDMLSHYKLNENVEPPSS
jgi:hypothetical protein